MTLRKNIEGFNVTYQIIMQFKLMSNIFTRIHKTKKKINKNFSLK